MDRGELEGGAELSSAGVVGRTDEEVHDGLLIDLRDDTVIDLRGLDGPRVVPALEPPPLVDPNRVPLVGSRWVLLVSLALLNALDLMTTRAVLAAGGREGNPLMAQVIHDPVAPILVKVAGLAIVAVVVNACPADSRLVNRALSLSVVVYSVVVSWNLVNLLLA